VIFEAVLYRQRHGLGVLLGGLYAFLRQYGRAYLWRGHWPRGGPQHVNSPPVDRATLDHLFGWRRFTVILARL